MKNFLKFMCFSFTICTASRIFEIDYNSNTFLKDGQLFSYISGSIHSYRIPRDLWLDRLNKMWAAGLNTIETYVFWNEHEQTQGIYDFEDQYNIFEFIEMAQKVGFLVILRPGPYVCAEHEYGGLPWWLLSNGTNSIVPRSSEKNFMNAVTTWFDFLLPKFRSYLYENGGPIISVQVENEYGAYYTCDLKYKNDLRDLIRKHLGNNVVLFTTDSYEPTFHFVCGVIDGVYSTIDFGTERDVDDAFNLQRKYSPRGPLVNSEFYTGWLDFWGFPHQKRATNLVVDHLEKMFNRSANVNFYMFHGGTNFGFSNGADPPYLTQPTSYDYDAPLTEAGDITDKYLAIRESILRHRKIQPPIPVPGNSTKLALGRVNIKQQTSLFDSILETCKNSAIRSEKPLTFEKLGQGSGLIMYSTNLLDSNVHGKVLSIPGIRDRAYIQIGNVFLGTVERIKEKLRIDLPNNTNINLHILVENSGRLNYGYLFDPKGIISDVNLDGQILTNWSHCLTKDFFPYFQLKLKEETIHTNFLRKLNNVDEYKSVKIDPPNFKIPAIYTTSLGPVANNSFDTFLKIDKFSKGIVLIDNGTVLTNLGRYWPLVGPQITLYVPGVFFSTTHINAIHIVEFENSLCSSLSEDCFVEFIDYPIIG